MAESVKSIPSAGENVLYEKEQQQPLLDIDPVEERKSVWKLDLCLIPIMTMFYLLSFLVRAMPNVLMRDISRSNDCLVLGSSEHWYFQLHFELVMVYLAWS